MSKPRLNAKVAKLEIGTPVLWSASGIGTVALDNAVQAGHIVFVQMPNSPDEFYLMRPAADQLDTMIKTLTNFGTTVYSFQEPVIETVSTESEPEMTTTTTAQTPA